MEPNAGFYSDIIRNPMIFHELNQALIYFGFHDGIYPQFSKITTAVQAYLTNCS